MLQNYFIWRQKSKIIHHKLQYIYLIMNLDIITALIAFAFVGSITPGPNNLMLMASATNFGMKKTIPHILGINIGFIVMIFLVGFGLMQIFQMFPATFSILKIISTAYLLYLAWKIATASAVSRTTGRANPMSFIQATCFQWINPKAWIMVLSTITTYAQSSPSFGTLCMIAFIYGVVMLPSVSMWAFLGTLLQRLLNSPLHLKIFNIAAALLLVASLYPVLFSEAF